MTGLAQRVLGTGPWVFLFLTVLAMGTCAVLAGQVLARSWRPASLAAWYVVLLTLADRFLSYALFGGRLLSVGGYLADGAVLLALALLSWRAERAGMMVRQYPWLYRRKGPFSWRQIADSG